MRGTWITFPQPNKAHEWTPISYPITHNQPQSTLTVVNQELIWSKIFISRFNWKKLQWILHDWNDEQCLKLLKNCYKALPDFGKVIVAEYILPRTPEANAAARSVISFDVLMVISCPGGKERRVKEFEALAKRAGFARFRVASNAYNFWVMEFYKSM